MRASEINLINRVIDLAEEKVPLKNEVYKKTADLQIEQIKSAWSKKYNEVFDDLMDLVLALDNVDIDNESKGLKVKDIKEKYSFIGRAKKS